MSASGKERRRAHLSCVPGEERAPTEASGVSKTKDSLLCPACGYRFITKVNGKHKLRTRVLVFAENGNTMGICPNCRTHLKVPVALKDEGAGLWPVGRAGLRRKSPDE
jgi:hypothetical protein